MYWDVVEVKPVGDRLFEIRFLDGISGTIRLDPAFCTGVFQPLLDDELVAQASVVNGVLVWPNGLDLAPDTMYHEIKRSPNRHYVLGRHASANGGISATVLL